ncbi:protein translocase subunit SecF [Porticoccus sp. W117]|uniref:protein translocase subunit SecF n=1 Tax=Porticoccus sp. W117 TaxID=3054777 RepID=UPI0025944602|nr:protein translocase subunit SecF [Porticoccus sp. W117]MDM3869997.1 protein translocase subunit SecF [Porticoccus sp. W117]
MGQRKKAAVLSVLLVIGSIVSLAMNGIQAGLDFTGGVQVEVGYEQTADLEKIRSQLSDAGFSPVVQHYGAETEVIIRMQENAQVLPIDPLTEKPKTVNDYVEETLRADGDALEIKQFQVIGSVIGEELRDDGGIGMLAALAIVMIYVAIRFQLKFSLGAVAALIHDVVIVLGFFSVFKLEFDLTVLAAVLAVIGYSLNDTIVVSDRIRENFRLLRKASPVDVINESLTQTLGRTLITSLTTLLVLAALYFVGGEMIHNFSIALIVGVLVGTYSSIYVAANILLAMHIDREDLMPTQKEGELVDDLP